MVFKKDKFLNALSVLWQSPVRSRNALKLLHAYFHRFFTLNHYPPGIGEVVFLFFKDRTEDDRVRFPITDIQPLIMTAIRLVQLAKTSDLIDVLQLFRGLDCLARCAYDDSGAQKVIKYISDNLNLRHITEQTLLPLDSARAAYQSQLFVGDSLSFDHFTSQIYDFYQYLQVKTGQITAPIQAEEQEQLHAEALALLDKAFIQNGGVKSAYIMASEGINGGIGKVLDQITHTLKQSQQKAYTEFIITEAIKPLEWGLQVEVVKKLMEQTKAFLPQIAQSQPPERFVSNLPPIIRAYNEHLDHMYRTLSAY